MYKKMIAPIILFFGAGYLYFFRVPNIKVMSSSSNSLLLPKILLILLMFLSGLEFIKILIFEKNQMVQELKLDQSTRKLLFVFLLAVGYLYGMTIVGYFLLTPIFMFAFISLLGKHRWWLTSLVSLGITVLVYFIFIKLLYIPLPKGIGVFKAVSEFIIY